MSNETQGAPRPQKRILTVGCEFPGNDFEHVDFDSTRSLDGDIVLFQNGSELWPPSSNRRLHVFEEDEWIEHTEWLKHWHEELARAAEAGRLIIIFLTAPSDFCTETGALKDQGPGNSYDAVPFPFDVIERSGNQVRLTDQAGFLSAYWEEFGPLSPYHVLIEGEFSARLLTTNSGDQTVAAAYLDGRSVLLLPPLYIENETYFDFDSDEDWTPDAREKGKRLAATLFALYDRLHGSEEATPPPEWALDAAFVSYSERILRDNVDELAERIAELQADRNRLEVCVSEEARIRDLLYEQGKPLERAVRDALLTLGFSVTRHDSPGYEVLFECEEGRALGVVEATNGEPVAIDAYGQLQRRLQEDFARREVEDFTKGVLFGNGNRLVAPGERGGTFAPKCISAARRAGVALVRTTDLFGPVAYLRGTGDASYAAACRQAILATSKDVVKFPPVPLEKL